MKANKKIVKKISAEELDERFERGEDVSDYVDEDSATKRFHMEMPVWMMKELEIESRRQGINRQALIKTWVTTKLDELRREKKAV
ncbi:MAG: hypothetical protein HYW49_12485 [Deltaproteobacteria bacterium]|nr:hypothetical protein [Deltaproteobacteria bacterium]